MCSFSVSVAVKSAPIGGVEPRCARVADRAKPGFGVVHRQRPGRFRVTVLGG